jgi:Fur family transcriptional regulator, peroxide stress response regulator
MNYEILLKEHGLKVTPQRVGILSIMDIAGHISLEDMYEKIKAKFTSISLATLYKNIHAMQDSALIEEVQIPHQKPRYEIKKAVHGHVLCEQCGSFVDIEIDSNTLMDRMEQKSGFTINSVAVTLLGVCEECRR